MTRNLRSSSVGTINCGVVDTPTSRSRPSGNMWNLLAAGIVLLGAGLSGVLLTRHLGITSGLASFDVCSKFFQSDCDSAFASNVSVQFGIPLAGWGVVHFSMIGASLLLARMLKNSFKKEATLAAVILCSIGVVVGGFLIWAMLGKGVGLCANCLVIHALNVVLLVAVLRGAETTCRELRGALGAGMRYLMGGVVANESLVRWKFVGFVCVGLVGIVSYQWVLIQYDRRMESHSLPTTFESVVDDYHGQLPLEIPVDGNDPRLGKANSPLQLLVFSDFECSSCRDFAARLTALQERHPNLSIVFKHYPLSNQCNETVQSNLHPKSCNAALAAEAAKLQGRFWEYHDAIFAATPGLQTETLHQIAQEVGLDVDKFQHDLSGTVTAGKVKTDVALGNSLEVGATPTLFLNGKRLSTRAMLMLDELIARESILRK